jgi:signal transduction histidine kinase
MAASPAGAVRRRRLLVAGLIPSVACAALAVYPPAFLSRLDLNVYDTLLGIVGFTPPLDRVVVVDVDDRSLSSVGQWPWRRDVMAQLIARLRALGAKTIALDIIFSEADRQELTQDGTGPDARFAESLRSGGVVMGYALTFGESTSDAQRCVLHPLQLTLVEPAGDTRNAPYFRAAGALCSLPALAEAAGASGFLNASPDADGILRRAPLVLDLNGQTYPGLALAAVLSEAAPQTSVLRAINAHTTSLEAGGLAVPLDGRGNLLLRFRGRNKAFPYLSAADVLTGAVAPGTFSGKMVFVGASALGIQELVATPFDRLFPGVEVQATIADNLLRGDFIRRPEHAVMLQALITLLAGLAIAWIIGRAGAVRGGLAALAGLIGFWALMAWRLGAGGAFLSPLIPSLGTLLAVAAVAFTSIAAQMRAAFVELQRARRASEAATHAKHEFLMTLSHELRTPLNAIYGYTQLLARGARRDDQQSKAVASIERNARAQARVIDDLLNASETATGSLRLDIRKVDLTDIVRSVLDVLRPAIDAKQLAFDVNVDRAVPSIPGDGDRLRQAVWHVISNAIKYTPDGGCVKVRLEWVTSSVQLTVTDNGAGIDPSFLPHLFEPFRQQDGSTTRRHGGLGLGLSLVRHIVELHGGSVTAESSGAGRGATFRMRLPLSSASTKSPAGNRISAVEEPQARDPIQKPS